MPIARMRTIRGPASYSTGGFPFTIGGIESIANSSGRMVMAGSVSSSYYLPQVTSANANVVTIRVTDSRSGSLEAAAAVDLSGVGFALVYEGV